MAKKMGVPCGTDHSAEPEPCCTVSAETASVPNALEQLAIVCERMERSDRAVEVDIALALGLDPKFSGAAWARKGGELVYHFTRGTPLSQAIADWPNAKWSAGLLYRVARYTCEFGAAMDLKGAWLLDYLQEHDEGYFCAGVRRHKDGVLARASGHGATAVLALCAAALRAQGDA